MILLLVSTYYPEIAKALHESAVQELEKHDFTYETVEITGAGELPILAQRLIQQKKPNAVLCMGCVIKGETDHYEYVLEKVTHGLMHVELNTNTPVLQGVLAVRNRKQAEKRTNLGAEWIKSAVELLNELKTD